MTRTRMLLTPMAMLARVAAAPLLRAQTQTKTQMRCAPAAKSIWVDAQRVPGYSANPIQY